MRTSGWHRRLHHRGRFLRPAFELLEPRTLLSYQAAAVPYEPIDLVAGAPGVVICLREMQS